MHKLEQLEASSSTEELVQLTNHPENKNFFRTALTWQGSVSPQVMPRVILTAVYSVLVLVLANFSPHLTIPITPFEYSGAVLAALLVIRINSGLDRWWEARKLWGGIVNQSRNLALVGYGYSNDAPELRQKFLRWVAAWPHIMRESLRNERDLSEVAQLIGSEESERIRKAGHMPTYVAHQIVALLRELRNHGLDDFAFMRAERERAILIDWIGACERIRNTPIPLALAIKMRQFILLFLLLLPIALVDRAGVYAPLVVTLASYPLFSLDEIGAELQNPFSPRNLSHLPLNRICKNIEGNVMSLLEEKLG